MATTITALPQANRGPGVITSPAVNLPTGVNQVVFTMILPQAQLENPIVLINDMGIDWFNPISQQWEQLLRTGQFIGGIYLDRTGAEVLQPKFSCKFGQDVQGQKVRGFVDLAVQLNIGFNATLLP